MARGRRAVKDTSKDGQATKDVERYPIRWNTIDLFLEARWRRPHAQCHNDGSGKVKFQLWRQRFLSSSTFTESKDTSKKKLTPNKRRKTEPKQEPALEVSNDAGKENGIANDNATPRGIKYWLMKAEPESRIVKGKVRILNLCVSLKTLGREIQYR
jgi:hypothetical protein